MRSRASRITSGWRGVLASALSLVAGTAAAAFGGGSGNVQYIYTYGDGSVLVTGITFTGAGCSNNSGFWIPGTHPHLAKILANVLAAKASGMPLSVSAKIDNCWYPEITNDSASYVVVGP